MRDGSSLRDEKASRTGCAPTGRFCGAITGSRVGGQCPPYVAQSSVPSITVWLWPPTQIVLRWHVQLGSIPIPKSADSGRQRENLDVFGFELSDAEMASISSLEFGRLWDADPNTHEEF